MVLVYGIIACLIVAASTSCALTILDSNASETLVFESPSAPEPAPYEILNTLVVMPAGGWDSCHFDNNTHSRIVLITTVSPCTIQDWNRVCLQWGCAGLILHTAYKTPGFVISRQDTQVHMVEVSDEDGAHIHRLLTSSHVLNASIKSDEPNEWVVYSTSREFIWAWSMPGAAAACIGIWNLFKFREKLADVGDWKSVPIIHLTLVISESAENGMRSAIGIGFAFTGLGAGYDYTNFILLVNLVVIIHIMTNLTISFALRDLYATPMPVFIKASMLSFCIVFFVLHYVYNIGPRSSGDNQWKLQWIGIIWVAMFLGTIVIFCISVLRFSLTYRKFQDQDPNRSWIMKQVCLRLQQCASVLVLDVVLIVIIGTVSWRSNPRLLSMSLSFGGWVQNVASILRMRAIVVPTQGPAGFTKDAMQKDGAEDRFPTMDYETMSDNGADNIGSAIPTFILQQK
uniref:Intimal thickness related receptor IRP domain-containing protein n=1 Tax=Spongospora subterranea TaxID=70186 RepID=A0A0H5RQN1_9EUKA|eukprot:CRZ11019.1 hypothetical protein [Spongospora subterranea]